MKKVLGSLKDLPITEIATTEVITIEPATTIKEACDVMVDKGIRRLPVVDSKTQELKGIISSMDLMGFFAALPKFNSVIDEYGNGVGSVINVPCEKIMATPVITFHKSDSIGNSARVMLDESVGGCPIIDKNNRMVGIVTEIDFIKKISEGKCDINVEDILSGDLPQIGPKLPLFDVVKSMVKGGLRWTLVREGEDPVGILRERRILKLVSNVCATEELKVSIRDFLKESTVSDAMNHHFVSVRKSDTIDDVVEMMIALRAGGFPVEENGKVVGISSEKTIFGAAYASII